MVCNAYTARLDIFRPFRAEHFALCRPRALPWAFLFCPFGIHNRMTLFFELTPSTFRHPPRRLGGCHPSFRVQIINSQRCDVNQFCQRVPSVAKAMPRQAPRTQRINGVQCTPYPAFAASKISHAKAPRRQEENGQDKKEVVSGQWSERRRTADEHK
jgi:hypothetical protein